MLLTKLLLGSQCLWICTSHTSKLCTPFFSHCTFACGVSIQHHPESPECSYSLSFASSLSGIASTCMAGHQPLQSTTAFTVGESTQALISSSSSSALFLGAEDPFTFVNMLHISLSVHHINSLMMAVYGETHCMVASSAQLNDLLLIKALTSGCFVSQNVLVTSVTWMCCQ